MRLKNAQKNVHDALFSVHGSACPRFLLMIFADDYRLGK
jgi:hypothetical protein